MPPKINGVNFVDLVKKEVEKSLEVQTSEINDMKKILQAELDTAHELLLGALARISCLEKEIQISDIWPYLAIWIFGKVRQT